MTPSVTSNLQLVLINTLAAGLLLSPLDASSAQTPGARQRVRVSQPGTVSQTVKTAVISLTYNRPVARGRTLFGPGGLVRNGRKWNPGADEASQITVSHDVVFAGVPLPAGSYTIWMIPDSNAWTVILSRATDVWHEPYPVGRDVLRVGIRPGTRDHMEALAFYFPVVGRSSAVLRLHWGTTVVDMPIEVGDGPGQESGSAPSGAP